MRAGMLAGSETYPDPDMSLDEFKTSLASPTPPPGLPALLRALWHDARGDWDEAHRIAQDVDDPNGAWVHGYLHRKEGDTGNAAYWYRRAGKPAAKDSLQQEWERITGALLSDG
jgi:hypothetical protein